MEINIRAEINELENIFNIKKPEKIYRAKTGSVLISITNSQTSGQMEKREEANKQRKKHGK